MSDPTIIISEVIVPSTIINVSETSVVVTAGSVAPQIIEVASVPGSIDGSAFFQTLLRLSELDDETKRVAARTNLGVETIDGGTFN